MKDKIHIIMGSVIIILLLLLFFKSTVGRFMITGTGENNAYVVDTTNGNVWVVYPGWKKLVKEK